MNKSFDRLKWEMKRNEIANINNRHPAIFKFSQTLHTFILTYTTNSNNFIHIIFVD